MIQVQETHQSYDIRASIPTGWGTLHLHGEVPAALVHQMAAQACAGRPELIASGDFFGDIAKGFGQMVKSKAFGDVTNVVSQIASSPLTQGLASAIGTPAAGMALKVIGGAAGAAHGLAERARAGDPRADRDVRAIHQQARKGNPRAVRSAKLLREAFMAQQAKDAIGAAALPAAPQPPAAFPYAQFLAFEEYRRQVPQQPNPAQPQPQGWASWG